MTSKNLLGAVASAAGVEYRVWAPTVPNVAVEIRAGDGTNRTLELQRDHQGYWSGHDDAGIPGDSYQYRLGHAGAFPDPVSRGQQDDVHGRSLVVDPRRFQWTDQRWERPAFRHLVIYELHVGALTPGGGFRDAVSHLPYLRDLGITAIELMPIADFPGARNWGYDGVLPYAPARCYGSPDDLRSLVDAAHQHGLAVILDVVYNHLGPDGNCLSRFSPYYFTERHHTPWGKAINFDGPHSGPVREYFRNNPVYWMEEFHMDGFRFDATAEIKDDSAPHILSEIAADIHERGGYAIAEDSRNEARLITEAEQGGLGFDGVWADDFHHSVRVGRTREAAAHFQDFTGALTELMAILEHGWLYRGQLAKSLGSLRGTACRHLPPQRFVHCISNHDQVGNRALGERINHLIPASAYRALSALLCLSPYTPLLFMGQEWAASSPFLFFCDHHRELGRAIAEGRRREFAAFPEFAEPSARRRIPDPQSAATFQQSKLRWEEVRSGDHGDVLRLYVECLRLRREIPALRPQSRDEWKVGELSWGAGAIRTGKGQTDYLLVFAPGNACSGSLFTEEIASLPPGQKWTLVLSSEEERFGGDTRPFAEELQAFHFEEAACLLLSTGPA